MSNSLYILGLCLILTSVLLTNCKKPNQVTVSIDKEEYNPEEQKEVGDNFVAYAEAKDIYKVLDRSTNASFYNYIDQLWASAVNNQVIENRLVFDWEVFIIEDDNIKTIFSVPGGKLYIYTGFLKSINNESELFSIMAHELYYIDKGAVLNAMINEYGTLIVGELWLNSDNNSVKDLVETTYRLEIPDFEVLAADEFAVNLVCPFRYDPKGLKSYLEIAYNSPEEIDWLTTRPGSVDRLAKIDAMVIDCGSEEFTFTERYAQYKAMLP